MGAQLRAHRDANMSQTSSPYSRAKEQPMKGVGRGDSGTQVSGGVWKRSSLLGQGGRGSQVLVDVCGASGHRLGQGWGRKCRASARQVETPPPAQVVRQVRPPPSRFLGPYSGALDFGGSSVSPGFWGLVLRMVWMNRGGTRMNTRKVALWERAFRRRVWEETHSGREREERKLDTVLCLLWERFSPEEREECAMRAQAIRLIYGGEG
jgi:hypothetical protein